MCVHSVPTYGNILRYIIIFTSYSPINSRRTWVSFPYEVNLCIPNTIILLHVRRMTHFYIHLFHLLDCTRAEHFLQRLEMFLNGSMLNFAAPSLVGFLDVGMRSCMTFLYHCIIVILSWRPRCIAAEEVAQLLISLHRSSLIRALP